MLPDWVEKQRLPATTVKQIGGSYYLYKATSKRVPGKKHPVSVQTYIGKITRDGIVDARRQIQVSATEAKLLRDLVPGIPPSLGGIILLHIQNEWYFTRISETQVRQLSKAGLYREEKLCSEKLGAEARGGER